MPTSVTRNSRAGGSQNQEHCHGRVVFQRRSKQHEAIAHPAPTGTARQYQCGTHQQRKQQQIEIGTLDGERHRGRKARNDPLHQFCRVAGGRQRGKTENEAGRKHEAGR